MILRLEGINADKAEALCRDITQGLPEYFGITSANVQYFKGVRGCHNLAAKINSQYVGLLSLNQPYENNCNIYWMAVLQEYQNNSIDSKLIEEACSIAQKKNARSITVETLAPNQAEENYLKTYSFYQSLGFTPLFNLKPEGSEWIMVYMVKQLDTKLDNLKN